MSLTDRKKWKMVNPKLISDKAVRITLIKVRSADNLVRWNDKVVRCRDNKVEISPEEGSGVLLGGFSIPFQESLLIFR
jgi:hypothetical protein